MDRTRIKLGVYINLDPIPGAFHTADNAASHVRHMLDNAVGHYNPTVSIESYGTTEFVHAFDSTNRRWAPEQEYNFLFVRTCFNHLGQQLQAAGHLFLNEVYDVFDLPRSREGAVQGWTSIEHFNPTYEPSSPNKLDLRFVTEGDILGKAFS